ncbi:MAG: radical SAM protein [Anaerolineales bacterium]
MNVVASAGHKDVAMVYVVDFEGQFVECVEAVQPPTPRSEKWVLMISTSFGCPIRCQMCDAGGHYRGKLSKEEMVEQIQYLISTRYPDGVVHSKQFKIQFARMGEPALNPNVLDLLEELPSRISAPGLMPSLSTVAPHGRDHFFDRLIEIKDTYYPGGQFQFQFSLHTTDRDLRDWLIPVRKWDFSEMALYGERYHRPGDRKITLNFALAEDSPLDVEVLKTHFDPDRFLIKITPLNPTYQAQKSGLRSYLKPRDDDFEDGLLSEIKNAGYQVILSIGDLEENKIGSNCGQYVQRHLQAKHRLSSGYSYQVQDQGDVP